MRTQEWDTEKVIDIILDLSDNSWIPKAACRDLDSNWWFPAHTHEDGANRGPDSYRPARAICKTCPVQAPCLDYALRNLVYFGMWGGMSPRERRNYRQKLRRKAS